MLTSLEEYPTIATMDDMNNVHWKGWIMIQGYVSIWKGIICVLPLTAIRGEWCGSCHDSQDVVTGTYKGKAVAFSVIHYSVKGE